MWHSRLTFLSTVKLLLCCFLIIILAACNKTQIYHIVLEVRSPKWISLGQKQGRAVFILEVLGETRFLAFLATRGCLNCLVHGLFIVKASHIMSSNFSLILFSSSHLLWFLTPQLYWDIIDRQHLCDCKRFNMTTGHTYTLKNYSCNKVNTSITSQNYNFL